MALNETQLLRVLTGADLREELESNTVSLRWATVTNLDPLEVMRDGEFDSFEVTGTAVPVEMLSISDRVRVSNFGSKAFIESSEYVLNRINAAVSNLGTDVGNLTSGLAAANLRWGTYMDRDTNFNDYTIPGIYYNTANANVATIANNPAPVAGSLHVENASSVIQTYHEYGANSTYARSWRRTYTSSVWSEWLPLGIVIKRFVLTLQNSWTNYGSPFATATVTLTRDGHVHLEGLVRNGTAAGTITNLPSWARPGASLMMTGWNNTGAVRLDIGTNGDIKQNGATVNGFVSLDGISFLAGS